jgi:hypothetical protein
MQQREVHHGRGAGEEPPRQAAGAERERGGDRRAGRERAPDRAPRQRPDARNACQSRTHEDEHRHLGRDRRPRRPVEAVIGDERRVQADVERHARERGERVQQVAALRDERGDSERGDEVHRLGHHQEPGGVVGDAVPSAVEERHEVAGHGGEGDRDPDTRREQDHERGPERMVEPRVVVAGGDEHGQHRREQRDRQRPDEVRELVRHAVGADRGERRHDGEHQHVDPVVDALERVAERQRRSLLRPCRPSRRVEAEAQRTDAARR